MNHCAKYEHRPLQMKDEFTLRAVKQILTWVYSILHFDFKVRHAI